MIIKKIYGLLVAFFMAMLGVSAQTVAWRVMPVYEQIKPYAPGLYLCQLNGKWGTLDVNGNLILSPQYDFITSQDNGIGLFGVMEGKDYRLLGFIHEDGTLVSLDETLYVVPEYLHFSEGKLCVSDASGKQGFIDEEGNMVVKCRFDKVRPFREGLASVNDGPWVYYIYENYDENPRQNVVYSEWRNGEITYGSSFKNGESVVGYGKKYRVMDSSGRELRTFDASKLYINPVDYTVTDEKVNVRVENRTFKPQYLPIEVFSDNGKSGFRSNDVTILLPALDNASRVDANHISVATYNGKVGLMEIISGSIKSSLLSKGRKVEQVVVNSANKPNTMQYAVILPKQQVGHTLLWVDRGNGIFEDVSSATIAIGDTLTYDLSPVVAKGANKVHLQCSLVYEGMEVFSEAFDLPVKRSARLRLSGPLVETKFADVKTEIQQVSATIHNNSDRSMKVTATLSVQCKLNDAVSQSFELTIPAYSSQRVSVPVRVRADEDVPAIIRLSSGGQSTKVVSLRIY